MFASVHVLCLNHCSLLISNPLSIRKLSSALSVLNVLLLKNSYLSPLFCYLSTCDMMDLWGTAVSNFRVLTYDNFQCVIKILVFDSQK